MPDGGPGRGRADRGLQRRDGRARRALPTAARRLGVRRQPRRHRPGRPRPRPARRCATGPRRTSSSPATSPASTRPRPPTGPSCATGSGTPTTRPSASSQSAGPVSASTCCDGSPPPTTRSRPRCPVCGWCSSPGRASIPRRSRTRPVSRCTATCHDLHHHLAACDIGVVQGGLTTTMELVAAGRPFVYVPLRHHFEQNLHVAHRLDRHGAGRRLDWVDADPGRHRGGRGRGARAHTGVPAGRDRRRRADRRPAQRPALSRPPRAATASCTAGQRSADVAVDERRHDLGRAGGVPGGGQGAGGGQVGIRTEHPCLPRGRPDRWRACFARGPGRPDHPLPEPVARGSAAGSPRRRARRRPSNRDRRRPPPPRWRRSRAGSPRASPRPRRTTTGGRPRRVRQRQSPLDKRGVRVTRQAGEPGAVRAEERGVRREAGPRVHRDGVLDLGQGRAGVAARHGDEGLLEQAPRSSPRCRRRGAPAGAAREAPRPAPARHRGRPSTVLRPSSPAASARSSPEVRPARTARSA